MKIISWKQKSENGDDFEHTLYYKISYSPFLGAGFAAATARHTNNSANATFIWNKNTTNHKQCTIKKHSQINRYCALPWVWAASQCFKMKVKKTWIPQTFIGLLICNYNFMECLFLYKTIQTYLYYLRMSCDRSVWGNSSL